MMKRTLAALVSLAMLACTAYAGNGVSGITVQLTRNLTSVGVKAIVSGDDDSSAVLRIFQRYETAGAYDSGMVMVRRPSMSLWANGGGSTIHAGRILWMTPGRTCYFRIEAVDAGGSFSTQWDTVSCAEVRLRSTGTKWYVNQATGHNGNSGLGPGSPKRTFNTNAEGTGALAALVAQNAQGSGIIVAPGEYHEKLSVSTGTDGFFHYIAGDGTNPDSTIICGANAMGEAGRIDASTSITWTARGYSTAASPPSYDAASGVYKAYLPYADSVGSVIFGFGENLHLKTSLLALFADSSGTATNSNLTAGTVGHGWFRKGDTLFVRRPNNIVPSGGVHFGYLGPLMDIARRNWRISGLTIRYAGGPISCNGVAGGTDVCVEDPPNSNYEGVVFGRNANSSGAVVDSCRFYGNSGAGANMRYTSAGLVCDSCTVSNSTFDGLTIGTMGYAATKSRLEENAGGIISVGLMSNVYNNTVRETANAIQLGPVTGTSSDSTWSSSTEVAYNRIYQGNDDAMETDTGAGINELILGNVTDGGNSGVSVAPIYVGPLWVLYNTFTRFVSGGIKIGFDGDGQVELHQNTMVSNDAGSRGFEGGSGGHYKVNASNNIFWGEVGIHGLGADAGDTTNTVATFNYNCLDSTATGTLIDRWKGTAAANLTLNRSEWRAYGNEANGQFGNPGLVNVTRGRAFGNQPNVRPKHPTNFAPNSLVIQRGRTLPGINSGLTGRRYAGDLPNIGSLGCYNCYYPEP